MAKKANSKLPVLDFRAWNGPLAKDGSARSKSGRSKIELAHPKDFKDLPLIRKIYILGVLSEKGAIRTRTSIEKFSEFVGMPRQVIKICLDRAKKLKRDAERNKKFKEVIQDEYLTFEEAANFLKVSPFTLKAWRYERNYVFGLPYIRMGRDVRYKLSDLRTFMNEHIVLKSKLKKDF